MAASYSGLSVNRRHTNTSKDNKTGGGGTRLLHAAAITMDKGAAADACIACFRPRLLACSPPPFFSVYDLSFISFIVLSVREIFVGLLLTEFLCFLFLRLQCLLKLDSINVGTNFSYTLFP